MASSRRTATPPSFGLHVHVTPNSRPFPRADDATHYDEIWGKDNIHIGYYPHLTDRSAPELNFQAAAVQITNRLIELGDISHDSRVLDLGCGKGIACAQIAELTGAQCTGLDLSPANIDRANDLAVSRPELRLNFLEGSFTDLPASLHGQFTHVIGQESFVHIHSELDVCFDQVKLALAPGGKMVVSTRQPSPPQLALRGRVLLLG